MKTILALAFLVAMLAIPCVVGDKGGVPNDNADGSVAGEVAPAAADYTGEDGPGFSEIGQAMADSEPGDGYEGQPGVSAGAPGHSNHT